jgi:glucokinase
LGDGDDSESAKSEFKIGCCSTPMTKSVSDPVQLTPGLVVGVDIGGSNLRLALADSQGTVLGKWRASTNATSSPETVIGQIEQGVEYLLRRSSLPRSCLTSIAAGVPGITNSDTGVVIATSYLGGWRDVPFKNILESALDVPAAVENDVRMAAIGEHWKGAATGVDDFVFLAIGTGIAAGIFANGKLLRGAKCTAGEVGYMYVPGTSEEPAIPGAPGSLESAIGGGGIREQYRNDGETCGSLAATEIFELAATGNLAAMNVLGRTAQVLAYAVFNIALVLDSSIFVLGGGVGMSTALRDAAQRVLERYSEPVLPTIVVSHLGEDAQLMGAIRLAMTTADARGRIESGKLTP